MYVGMSLDLGFWFGPNFTREMLCKTDKKNYVIVSKSYDTVQVAQMNNNKNLKKSHLNSIFSH